MPDYLLDLRDIIVRFGAVDWLSTAGLLCLGVLLSIPAVRVTLRGGLLRGLLAVLLAGLAYVTFGVCVIMAFNLKDHGVLIQKNDFALGFGLGLWLGGLGLFWLPVQVLALVWALWRRRRSRR